MHSPDLVDNMLDGWQRIRESCFSATLIYYQYLLGLYFCHDFYRVSRNDELGISRFDQPYKSPLKIRMHVDVWFIQDDRVVGFRASQEPHGLKPHLQAVAHPTYFCNEVTVPDQQI
jgi:hypothetical protein